MELVSFGPMPPFGRSPRPVSLCDLYILFRNLHIESNFHSFLWECTIFVLFCFLFSLSVLSLTTSHLRLVLDSSTALSSVKVVLLNVHSNIGILECPVRR